jgi:hypothetical protein
MELGSILKAIVLWPLLALVDVPFVRLGARILKVRRPKFGATYLLVLIAGAAMFLANLVLSLVLPPAGSIAALVVTILAAILVYGWVFGYFLTDNDGLSIGYWKGTQVFLLASALFAALLVAIAIVVVGIGNIWGI